jgi:Spy/CpxP family protein refolding chaperone
MKKIIVLMLAMVTIVAAQAQKERIPEQQRGFRDKMMAEKLNLSDEQKQKAKALNEDYRKKMDELRKKGRHIGKGLEEPDDGA